MSQFRFTLVNGLIETVINEPMGWDTGLFNINRDKEMHGLFFAYTSTLEFVDSGYDAIKEVYDVDGIRTLLFLRIELDCDQTGDFEQIYYGKLDFSTEEELSSDYCSFSCAISPSIEEVMLKDNRATTYTITKNVTLLGQSLNQLYPYGITTREKEIELETNYLANIDYSNYCNGTANDTGSLRLLSVLLFNTLPAYQDTFDGNDHAGSDSSFFDDNNPPNVTGHHMWKSPVDGMIKIDFKLFGFLNYSKPFVTDTRADFIIYRNENISDVLFSSAIKGLSNDTNYSGTFLTDGTVLNIAVNESDTIGWVILYSNTIINPTINPFTFSTTLSTDSFFNITFNEKFGDTISSTVLLHDVFRRLSQNILNKENAFYSELLGLKQTRGYAYTGNGCAGATAITNGYNLRGFTFDEKPLFSNFDDAYNSLNSIWNTGIGIETIGGERRIRIEPKAYFYNFSPSITLDLIKEIKYAFSGDYIYDNIIIGFKKYGTEDGTEKTGTIDSFATKRQFKTPFVGLANNQSLELFSEWIADHYTIEFTRRKQILQSGSSSWKFDEDNFIICLSRQYDGSPLPQNEQAEAFDIVDGISTPLTSYNLRIAPANNLLRWLNFLFMGYKPTDLLKFTFGTIHIPMETRMINQYCDGSYNDHAFFQNQDLSPIDVNIASREPILMPRTASFAYPLSWTQYKTIRDNPTKAIQFNKDGVNQKLGFIQSVNYSPVTGQAQFVLLLAKTPQVLCSREYGDPDYVECGYSV